MKKTLITLSALTFPALAFAQGVQDFLVGFIWFGNNVIIPFIFAIAFLFFIWNAFLFFILGGADGEGKEKAKKLMLYGLMAMVLMVVIWGVVAMGTRALGINRTAFICPDFMPSCRSGQGTVDTNNWISNYNNDRSF